ncbi:transposable element Tcb1 transposase [Trichonephila clavipes]|nr:transposable element Tcb1 transposase [Trichonephila clavipes]
MVWAGISLEYRTDLHIFKRGSVTAVRYRDEVLEPIVRLYAAAVDPTFVLMDDNARPHRADIVDDYLESEGIVRIAWPAYSPDLNPIEILCDALGRAVSSRFPPLATLIELETDVQEEWRLLNSALVDHPIESIVRRLDGAVKTYIQSQSIPKSFYELKNNLIREFGTQVNPAEIHLQLSKTEKTSKETHIEYFYRVKEIASRINMEEEAEKYYIIRGLKEIRAIEIQLQSCSNIEELKEKMKLLDIQEKSKSSKNEVIYPKYPVTKIPHHTNQFARRQQYGGWNWRNDQSQHPDAITGSRYNVYSPQLLSPSYHHPSFSLQRPTLYPRNQRFPQRPSVLRPNTITFYPRKEHKTIIRYSNLIKHENL